MDFIDLAKARFSVRDYSDKPIEPEKLSLIIEAAKVAPTAANKQPQKIYVLKSKEAIEKVRGITRCAFNAPVVFMISYDTEREWKNPLEEGITSGVEDVSIVATHMMMEAWDLGIGSCWVNAFANSAAHEAFDLPETEKVILLMPMGYPSDKAEPRPQHTTFRELDDFVKEL